MIVQLPRRIEDLALFTRHLSGAMNSRVPLHVILRAYAHESGSDRLARTAEKMAVELESGVELAAAMEKYPDIFPKAYRRLVNLGEQSKTLGGIMQQLAVRLDESLRTYEYFRRAAIYPAAILLIIFGIAVFVNTWIMPKYEDMFQQLGISFTGPYWTFFGSPASSIRIGMVAFSIILLLPIGFLLATALGLKLKGFGYGRLALQLPLIGPVFRRAEAAQMASYLALLVDNHIPLGEALGLLADSSENSYVSAALEDFHQRYQTGERLSDLIHSQPLFPAGMAAIIAVAEDQGGMADTLRGLGQFYAERTVHGLTVLREIFEPVMLVLVGLLIGIFLLATYFPMFEIPRSIQ